MIRLQTLGGIGLEDPDRPELPQLLRQPKAFALLCYLALGGPRRFRRRDAAIELFWPELDHDHGRAALRQTLRVLRRFLGTETIVNRGDDEIGLDSDRIWCDAAAFEQLCEAGEVERAMALYQGDLIDRLHVAGAAPELSHWLDAERLRLRRQAQEIAWRCARLRGDAGDAPGAIRSARRAVLLEPFDERGLRALLELLDHAGERATAVREYEQFAARLAQEFEVGPANETKALIASIRSRLPEAARPAPPADTGAAVLAARPSPAADPPPSRASRAPRTIVLVTLIGLTLAFALAASRRRDRPVVLSPTLVAVMPWRVSGADSGLAYLREGMLDLLDATLTGDRGLHATDPRTVLRAWKALASPTSEDVSLATATEIARGIGAGRLIQGAVVGTPAHLTLEATEFTTPGTRPTLTVGVTGSIDSLPAMVERLTAQILAHETRDPEERPRLATTSLPALRVYLEGRAAFRRGLYGEATHDFDQALTLDTTFTLAALSLANAGLTFADGALIDRGKRIAWRDASRLSTRDRALLVALVGEHYPAPTSERDDLKARERAVALAPGSPEAAYWLADSYFHHGRLLALPDWRARAIAGFERAIELDSGYAEPYQHLIEIKLAADDTIGVRGLAATYFALDSVGEYGDFPRWRVALGMRDSTALAVLRARFGRMSIESLHRIATTAQLQGIALEDAERAVASLNAQANDNRWRLFAAYDGETLWSNEGRPASALAATASITTDTRRPLADRWFQVSDALYSDGDTSAAGRAIAELGPLADGPTRVRRTVPDSQDVATCAVALWRLHRHETRGIGSAIHRLREVAVAAPGGFGVWMNACAIILDAQLSAELGSPDTLSTMARLDSLMDTGPTEASPVRVVATLVAARLEEQRGNLRAALAAVRRRENNYTPRYVAAQLLEEGRLAALLGERAEAIRAYSQYLVLRAIHEPALQPKVDSVRAALATLQRAPS